MIPAYQQRTCTIPVHRPQRALQIAALVSIAALSACGGGGSSAPAPAVPVPSSVPVAPQGMVNQATSYEVYTGSYDGIDQVVSISPVGGGVPAGMAGASLALGANVVYPDGTIQSADALGVFDASQSTWALSNQTALAADPTLQPAVDVLDPAGIAATLSTVVDAYAPDAALVPGSARRAAAAAQPTAIVVVPKSLSLHDNERRVLSVAASANGKRAEIGPKAAIVWTLGANANCAKPAGTLETFAKDAAHVRYVPPKTGTSSAACPDVVSATLTLPASSAAGAPTKLTASATVRYLDHKERVSVAGVLLDANKQPVAKGLIAFSGGKDLRLTAETDKNGAFKRALPAGQTFSVVAGNRTAASGGKTKLVFYNVAPASYTAPAASATGVTFTETAPRP